MCRPKLASLLPIVVTFALTGYPCSANATVLIKTFQFSICVTGTKHSDACKNVDADAHVVVGRIRARRQVAAIAISTNVRDFKAAREHVKGPKGPSRFLFYRMLARIYAKLDEMEAIEPVGFIFDNSEAKSMRFYNIWYKAKKYRKFARDRLASITFGDDTLIACQRPPRGAGTPRAFRATCTSFPA